MKTRDASADERRAAPLSAEDKLAIQESIIRLSYCYADGDVPGFVALFDEHAVLEVGWSPTQIAGRHALESWLSDLSNLSWTVKCSRVWVGNILVEGSGAAGVSKCVFNRIGLDGESLSTGTWTGSHRKAGGHWLISNLRVAADGTQEEFAAKQALAIVRARRRQA